MHKIQLCKYMFSYVHQQLPTPLLTMFHSNYEIHHYNTRQQYDPHIQARHSDHIAKTFIHQGPKCWSEIPANIK